MPKLTKDEYEQKMKEEVDMLYLYFPRSPEREHIITTLTWAFRQLYPVDPTLDNGGDDISAFSFTPEEFGYGRRYVSLSGRAICGYERNGMICHRDPRQLGPCAMGWYSHPDEYNR